ncbi:glycosyltransferase [Microbacterium sp. NPDC055455]
MTRSVAILGTRGYPSYYGGFETAVRKLAPFLAEQGWDVTVYSREGAVREDDPLRDPRVKVVYTSGLERKSASTLSFGYTASRHAIRARPDVALVMNVANGYFLPSLKRASIPTVVNVDGIEWHRAKWGRLAKAMFKHGATLTAKWGDALVFDALEIGRFWNEQFSRDGWYIPYGGDPVPPLPVEPGYTSGDYALVVARFVPENTIPEFIEATTEIATSHRVVIVGSSGYGGEIETRVRELVASNENIAWLGHVSDDARLHALWQHAGAYFHGHSVGGTNPALVQAMAAGAPVVARDTVYNREVLGQGGHFVPPDPHSIAMGVRRMLTDQTLRNESRRNSLQRAQAEYTWESVCARYEEALLSVIEHSKAVREYV